MEEQAVTPTQEPVDNAPSSPSWDDKLAKALGMGEPEPRAEDKAQEAQPVTSEAKSDDLAPEDLPQEDAGEPGEWLEIERKGEKRRLSKDEAKRFAQMGLDYNVLMEQSKAERENLTQLKAALTAKAQLTPQVLDAAANVKYFERALQQYNSVDWVQFARQDPVGYPEKFAAFDQLREGYKQAVAQFQHVANAVQQADVQIDAAELAKQRDALFDMAPELRDPQKLASEQGRMIKFVQEVGLSQEEVSAISSNAKYFALVRDAMRYRQAVKAKSERQANSSPTLRPGPAPTRQTESDKTREVVKALHQAKDPQRKKELFDAALERKLARFF